LAAKDEQARLDNIVVALQSSPTDVLYVIGYGGRKSVGTEAATMATRASTYITKNQRVDRSRAVTVNGGYKETPTIELWMVPQGATPPMASPTVDPSEVKPDKKPVKKTVKRGRV
jgi:hypothetical protein